jgi:hypothetical protein
VLAGAGLLCIGVAAANQQHARQPRRASIPVPSASPDRSGAPLVVGPVLPASAPLALTIPAIGVTSSLLRLGQTARGVLEVPPPGSHYDQAGWYRYSPTPGSLGPSIIAGHVDSARAGPSVFFRLGRLHPKDTILVKRADGLTAVFTVDAVGRYPKTRFPTELVYGNTNRAALRLITCGGPFDRRTRNYLDNIVVFASLVRSTA